MSTLPQTIYAVQHLAFEDLGSLEDSFYRLGFRVRYVEAGVDDLTAAFNHSGLTIILGGPIGSYESQDYPFLAQEIALLKQRLAEKKPTIGICLGAQLIAAALEAKVYAGPQKEIGWSALELKSIQDNPLEPLQNVPVLHWHGDTFDLPKEATLLASTALYSNQAFCIENYVLALQFHIEVDQHTFERWLIGHTCELRKNGSNIHTLREDNARYGQSLAQASHQVIQQFLKKLSFID